MAVLDDLNTAYQNLAKQLAQLTASPRPNYSVDGESYSWSEYFHMLNEQLLATEQAIQRATGPFQVSSRIRT